jgi:hypothetical protein
MTDYQARVNGDEIANLDAYCTASPKFNLTLPENNVWDAEPGVLQAVSGGLQLHHHPATTRSTRDHSEDEAPQRTRARSDVHGQPRRRSTSGDRANDNLKRTAPELPAPRSVEPLLIRHCSDIVIVPT